MMIPLLVVVTVCLHVWHPPLFTHWTVMVPSMDFLLFALQSGLFGSALVHSQLTLTSVSKPTRPSFWCGRSTSPLCPLLALSGNCIRRIWCCSWG